MRKEGESVGRTYVRSLFPRAVVRLGRRVVEFGFGL